jgi:hypothetical protein
MAYADVAVSSDNLSPRLDWKGGASYPIWGTFNTGIVFMRATPAGILFADAWFHNLAEAPGRYAPLTSDQQVRWGWGGGVESECTQLHHNC